MQQEILAFLRDHAGEGFQFKALVTHLTAKLNTELSEAQVRSSLEELKQRQRVSMAADVVRLTEPDVPERQLYESLGRRFTDGRFLRSLGVATDPHVFQDTSTGGVMGHGPLSKPDFTLAAVKCGLYSRIVEVTTFEVKNRSGASVRSVLEVVGHEKVSHYPFLACPTSELEADKIAAIREASRSRGVGLILFDIEYDGSGNFAAKKVRIDTKPQRKSPSLQEVDKYLNGRLTPDNHTKLQKLAGGT